MIRKPITLLYYVRYLKEERLYIVVNRLFLLEPFLGKDYEIIHCHFGPHAKGFIFLKDILTVKFVTTFHGYGIRLGEKNGNHMYRSLFKKGDMFCSISTYNTRRLVEFGCPREKIVYHPIGLNIPALANTAAYRRKAARLMPPRRLSSRPIMPTRWAHCPADRNPVSAHLSAVCSKFLLLLRLEMVGPWMLREGSSGLTPQNELAPH